MINGASLVNNQPTFKCIAEVLTQLMGKRDREEIK
jgi:hypothetical protein